MSRGERASVVIGTLIVVAFLALVASNPITTLIGDYFRGWACDAGCQTNQPAPGGPGIGFWIFLLLLGAGVWWIGAAPKNNSDNDDGK